MAECNFNTLSSGIEHPGPLGSFGFSGGFLLDHYSELYGWSGSNADRAKRLQLSEQTISCLTDGNAIGFSLSQLIAIARKAGVGVKVLYPAQQFSA